MAARLRLDSSAVHGGAVGLAGVHPRPLLVDLAGLAGGAPGREVAEAAGAAAAAACDPASDQRGSAAYKRAMVALWTTRTLLALMDG